MPQNLPISEPAQPPKTSLVPASEGAATPTQVAGPQAQVRNPLHGVTLEAMVLALHDYYGWECLAQRIPVRCFALDPSVKSSLKFLRKTPWAREKVEGLYLYTLREQTRLDAQRRRGR